MQWKENGEKEKNVNLKLYFEGKVLGGFDRPRYVPTMRLGNHTEADGAVCWPES